MSDALWDACRQKMVEALDSQTPQRIADRMSEADLEKAVRGMLATYRLFGYHPYDSRRSEPGWPDWVIVGKRVLYRELKSADGQLSPAQVRVRTLLVAAGADWGLWRPADLASGRIAQELAAIRP